MLEVKEERSTSHQNTTLTQQTQSAAEQLSPTKNPTLERPQHKDKIFKGFLSADKQFQTCFTQICLSLVIDSVAGIKEYKTMIYY